MSFSSDVKQELAQVPVLSDCCAQARAYGMLLFGRMFSVSEISFVTENENIAKLYCDVIKELFDITPSVSSGVSKYTVSVADEADRKRILEFFGHSESDISLRTTTTGRRTCRDPDAAAAAKTHCSGSFRFISPA